MLPRDGLIYPPGPTTLDVTDTSVTLGPLHPRPSVTPFNSSNQHTPAGILKNPILPGLNQRGQGEAAQKRKASEALPPPDPPNPPKIQKVERRAKPVSQPGLSKDNREDGEVGEGEAEDGEVYGYGEREPGEKPDYGLAHPHGAEYAWDQSGTVDDLYDLW